MQKRRFWFSTAVVCVLLLLLITAECKPQRGKKASPKKQSSTSSSSNDDGGSSSGQPEQQQQAGGGGGGGVTNDQQSPASQEAMRLLSEGEKHIQSSPSTAIEIFQRAIALSPKFAEAYAQLGNAYRGLQRRKDAVNAFKSALKYRRNPVPEANRQFWAYVQTNFGYALAESDPETNGKQNEGMKQAAEQFRQVIELMPTFAMAYRYLASAYMELKDLPNAIEWFSKGVKLSPNDDHQWFQLANSYNQIGDENNAERFYLEATRVNPKMAGAYINLGTIYQKRKRLEDAVRVFRLGVAADPRLAAGYTNLGIALQDLDLTDEAVEMSRIAVELDGTLAAAYNNYGRALESKDDYPAARRAYGTAVDMDPTYLDAFCGLAFVDMTLAFWEHRTATMKRIESSVTALLNDPNRVEKQQCVQPFRGFPYDISPELHRKIADDVVRDAQRIVNLQPTPRLALSASSLVLNMDRGSPRLRIGYLSSDFGAHTVGSLIRPLFGLHSRANFEIFCFALGVSDNTEWRHEMERTADSFISVGNLKDWEIASQINARQIHVIVDLNGHSKGARPGILLRRPSPSLLSWLGFPSTLGGGLVDGLVTDRVALPPDIASTVSERVMTLPNSYFITDHQRLYPRPFGGGGGGGERGGVVRGDDGEEIEIPSGRIVFANFGQLYKVAPELFDIWADIVTRVNGSLWLLKFPQKAAPQIIAEAKKRGLKIGRGGGEGGGRLEMTNLLPLKEHIALKSRADIALDTLLFNAHSTGADTLWGGVPLLSLPGDRMAARAGASFAVNMLDTRFLARNLEDYRQIALQFASLPPPQREKMRKEREMQLSTPPHQLPPLFNTGKFVRDLERTLKIWWESHLQSLGGGEERMKMHVVGGKGE